MKTEKFYVVWKGRETGIFSSWQDCEKQIKGFQGASYKSFPTKKDAEDAFKQDIKDSSSKNIKLLHISPDKKKAYGEPNWKSIAVDAACSGNPGVMEYRGVNLQTNTQIFRKGPFPEATINIGEFLAIVHALAYLQKKKSNVPIYSDSMTAITWIRRKAIKTKLEKSAKNKNLFEIVERALTWLQNNSYKNPILKWHTDAWGEIPADFGRK